MMLDDVISMATAMHIKIFIVAHDQGVKFHFVLAASLWVEAKRTVECLWKLGYKKAVGK